MEKYQQLKDILSTTVLKNEWDSYALVFKYVMKTIKGLALVDEDEVKNLFN
jgi:hypothetical protein